MSTAQNNQLLFPKRGPQLFYAIAADGENAVHGRIKLDLPAVALAWADQANAFRVDDTTAMNTDESVGCKDILKFAQLPMVETRFGCREADSGFVSFGLE